MDSNDQNIDLSYYRLLTIEDNHKIAILNILNSIISEPTLQDFSETKAVVFKLGSLIELFDDSFITSAIGGQSQIKMPAFNLMEDSNVAEISGHIRNWLMSYYNADSIIESLKLEDGIQEEISIAALLILNVFHQLKESLPQYKDQLDQHWVFLAELDDRLEAMWKTDKAFNLLQTELECERIQRLADKQKLTKLEKEVNSYKRKVKQSKEMLEKLKKYATKPAPKSKKRGAANLQTQTSRRGRPKKGGRAESSYRYSTGGDSDIEPDAPPLPGTPVLLSSSGTGSSCRYCGKWFNDGMKLNKHIVIHAGSKPFACDWPGCGRPFDSNYKLQRHRRCHTGERPFACDKCDKRFTRSDKLREHQKLHDRVSNKSLAEQMLQMAGEEEEENGKQSIDLPEEQNTDQTLNV